MLESHKEGDNHKPSSHDKNVSGLRPTSKLSSYFKDWSKTIAKIGSFHPCWMWNSHIFLKKVEMGGRWVTSRGWRRVGEGKVGRRVGVRKVGKRVGKGETRQLDGYSSENSSSRNIFHLCFARMIASCESIFVNYFSLTRTWLWIHLEIPLVTFK